MKTKYTLDYFIAKFEAIPRNKWCTGAFDDELNRRCALGHCGHLSGFSTEVSEALEKLVPGSIVRVNDGAFEYRKLGKHPKTRILRYLRQLKREAEKRGNQ